jgi:hypothetical protein
MAGVIDPGYKSRGSAKAAKTSFATMPPRRP